MEPTQIPHVNIISNHQFNQKQAPRQQKQPRNNKFNRKKSNIKTTNDGSLPRKRDSQEPEIPTKLPTIKNSNSPERSSPLSQLSSKHQYMMKSSANNNILVDSYGNKVSKQ